MKTLIRIQGYILNANVFEPHWKWGDDAPKYELYLTPYDSNEFYILEDMIEHLKREHKYSKPQSTTTPESIRTQPLSPLQTGFSMEPKSSLSHCLLLN